MFPPRTYLYVPADRPQMLARAAERGSDALILDLEDGITRNNHATALDQVRSYAATAYAHGPELWVRLGPEDVRTPGPLLEAGIRRFVFPKITPRRLEELVGRAGEDIEVLGLLESAHGIVGLAETASHPAVARLGIGAVDLAADLGLAAEQATGLLAPVRLQVVIASAAVDLPAPVGPTSLQLEDLSEVEASSRQLAAEGFGARTSVHPKQLPAIHRGLAPTEAELHEARMVIETLTATEAAGAGSARTAGGTLVDDAVARRARTVLARANASLRR